MQFAIEKLTAEMIESVMEIEVLSFKTPWQSFFFKEELENPFAIYFVAILNNEIIGYGGFWAVLDEGNITNIATHPDFRRLGVARKIIEKIIQVSKEKNLSFLTLEVRESNAAARKFYSSLGFNVVGKREKYYDHKEDAILMTLYLN